MFENVNTLNAAQIPAALIETATPNYARTRRNTAKFVAALDAGFEATGRKGEDNRTNPFWVEIETFQGTLRVLYVNVAQYMTPVSRDGRKVWFGINRPGAIVVNAIERTIQ